MSTMILPTSIIFVCVTSLLGKLLYKNKKVHVFSLCTLFTNFI